MRTLLDGHRTALATLLAASLLVALPAAASAQFEGGVQPGDPSLVDVVPKRSAILKTARAELARNVRERKGDNIPRYDYGKGPITPYSIRDQWCVAFSSWTWQQAGFDDYMGTRFLRTALSLLPSIDFTARPLRSTTVTTPMWAPP